MPDKLPLCDIHKKIIKNCVKCDIFDTMIESSICKRHILEIFECEECLILILNYKQKKQL
jgi:hypothetical protein